MTIKEARLAANLTQLEVVELLQIPRRTLQAWELEQRVPPVYVEKFVVEKLQSIAQGKEDEV